MFSIFGKKKKDEPPTTQEAIQKLRSTEELLQKKSDFLEKKIGQELVLAKQNASKNKRAALNALKRKKRLEKQLNQIDGTLSTIEFQREALEGANTNTEVLKNMSYAAKALKAAHQQLDVDDVHDMMDDIQEQTELADEISRAISEPVGFGQDIDEEELNAELEELEQEGLDEELLKVGGTAELPTVPTTELPAQPAKAKAAKQAEDDDMAELEAWAS
ncbi:charged multivesicular body protein 4b-like [Actinia tenebrosa]|uniref:Charged multivesicular body protein 4b-like n=1 Tax=Actinia tenebrosa TaxID=6105 RepID=A0A6P8IEC3_ACTTE|nr:charged multivesicular body protein 4b-like [Actinia tenebrosa]